MGFVDLNNGSSGPSRSAGFGDVLPIFSRHLDTTGDGSGTKNAIGDYSGGGGTVFKIQPAPGQIIRVTRMIVFASGKKTSFNTDTYGSLTGSLTNGVVVRTQNDGGTLINLTDNIPIKYNGDWGRVCYDSDIFVGTGGTDTSLRVRWTFEKAGYPLRLVGNDSERLEVYLNDDFTDGGGATGLSNHYFVVQGFYEQE